MAVDAEHPRFTDRVEEWQLCGDALRGEQAVKEAGSKYLPCPTGFEANPDKEVGRALYNAYLERAEFPDLFGLTLRGMVGLIHKKEAVIDGITGTQLEKMWESATRPSSGQPMTLAALHQEITRNLLAKGRVGLLAEAASTGSDTPWLALYNAESIRNWSDNYGMFVLDESGLVQSPNDEFGWVDAKKYRVLRIDDGGYYGQVYEDHPVAGASPDPTVPAPMGPAPATNEQALAATRPRGFQPATLAAQTPASTLSQGSDIYEPKIRGGKKMDFIPFVVGGPTRMGPNPENPPLLPIARAAKAIYQLNADYRHQLFMSGQETLVVIGVDKEDVPTAVGAGVVVGIPLNGDAKYVSPTCSGINAHKVAITDKAGEAVSAGVQLMDQGGSQQSGDALRLRYGAQTATLVTIANQSAAILETGLRYCARMVGMPEDKVQQIVVKPNTEFLDTVMSPQDAQALVAVWQSGAIAYDTLFENLVRGGIASGERTAEEEQELIDEETPDTPLPAGGTTDPTATPADTPPATDTAGEAGPDSITDEELTAMFGSYADDVVGGGGTRTQQGSRQRNR